MARKARWPRSRDWLAYAMLLAVTIAAYGRVHTLQFVSVDDPAYVSQNWHVLDGITRESLRWAFTTFHSANWHPLTWLSHMLDVQLYGRNPLGHHLTSLALHAANVLLLFALLRQITQNKWRSVFVAALFAVHPLRVESVAWVAERKDVLSTFFFLLMLFAYAGWVSRPTRLSYVAVCAALVLGLMAKPMLVSAPLVLLMLDYWPLRRGLSWPLVREKLPLFALAGTSCVVTFVAQQHGGAVQGLDQYSFGVRLANAAVAYVAYLVKMLWPVELAVIYPHPGSGLPAWQVAASAVLLPAVTCAVVRCARRAPYVAVGWAWYVVTLIPVIGLVQVGKQSMADRYTYIPLIGVFVAVTWALAELSKRIRLSYRTTALAAAGVAVVAVLAAMTIVHMAHWRTGVTLFRRAVAVTPGSYMLHYCLADAYLEERRPREAVPELRKVIKLKPDLASGHDVLGFVLAKLGNTAEGIKEIRTALRLEPRMATAWNNLGGIYSAQGKSKAAIDAFTRSVKIRPSYPEARFNLGAELEKASRLEEAERHYLAAIEADSRFVPALSAIGSLKFRGGYYREAEAYLRRALRLDATNLEAQLFLGATLVQTGRYPEAIPYLNAVIDARPNWPVGHYNMSMALYHLGEFARAREELDAAARLGMKPEQAFEDELNRRLANQQGIR